MTDGSGNVNNVIQVTEVKEPETKVVEAGKQSVPVRKEEPTPEVAAEEDKSAPEVSSQQDELPRAVPVPEISSKKNDTNSDIPIKEDKPAPVAPAKENKPVIQRVFSKETLSTIKTTASELTDAVSQEVSSVQSMLRTSEEDVKTPSRQVPETPAQKSQSQNGQVNGAQKPIGSCMSCLTNYLEC